LAEFAGLRTCPPMTAEAQAIKALPLPRIVGRRTLLKLLARGGMGDVYLASTMGLEGAERPCVVKTVRRDHIHDGSFLARFLDEARVQSQLNDPGVAQVLEAGMDDQGEPYTVVEYVEGRSLAEVRQRAIQLGMTIGWAEAVALTIEMSQALAHVHERAASDGTALGIVHRDLSPQNVMVAFGGDIKLIDFGTARGQNRRCHTVAGVVFAKPGYVAPEIARHEVGDARIDLYALGVMLWELARNQRFLSQEPQKHLEELARNRVRVPKIANTLGAPPELDAILAQILANAPDERYPSARAFAQDLARLLAKAPPSKHGERSVRGRIATLMQSLFPGEPARSRAEFTELMQNARNLMPEGTPPSSGVALAAAKQCSDPSLLAGTPYRLGRKIGDGSSGSVYEAEHLELGRKVALKILDSAHSSGLESVERFRQEARGLANLRHRNLAYLHDFGKAVDGRIFLAMELLKGETLAAVLARKSNALDWYSPKEATELAICICNALEEVHNAQLVHRDIKPENLFLTEDGTLKLIDFGIALTSRASASAGESTKPTKAKAAAATDKATEALSDNEGEAKDENKGEEKPATKAQGGFAIFGTPDYMAPEQVAGETVDVRADLYAVGAVLFEMLSGQKPYTGSPVEVMGKKLREEPTRLRSVTTRVPKPLELVVMRCLSRDPQDRYGSAVELRFALEKALRPASFLRPQHAAWAGAALATVLLGLGIRHAYRGTSAASASVQSSSEAPSETAATAAALPLAAGASSHESEASMVVPLASAGISASTQSTSSLPTPSLTGALVNKPGASQSSSSDTAKAPADEKPIASGAKPRETEALEEGKKSGGNKAMTLAEARKLAEAQPTSLRAQRRWATLAATHGTPEEAKTATMKWMELDGSAEPRIAMARLLIKHGQSEQARKLLALYTKNHHDTRAEHELARISGKKAEPGSREDAIVRAKATTKH
jgi:eukaryotic-like serine/threonine-protein kinase